MNFTLLALSTCNFNGPMFTFPMSSLEENNQVFSYFSKVRIRYSFMSFLYSISNSNIKIHESHFQKFLSSAIMLHSDKIKLQNTRLDSQINLSIDCQFHIENCLFEDSFSPSKGGAIQIESDVALSCTNTIFINCSSSSDGGAIYAVNTKDELTSCRFENCAIINSTNSQKGQILSMTSKSIDENCIKYVTFIFFQSDDNSIENSSAFRYSGNTFRYNLVNYSQNVHPIEFALIHCHDLNEIKLYSFDIYNFTGSKMFHFYKLTKQPLFHEINIVGTNFTKNNSYLLYFEPCDKPTIDCRGGLSIQGTISESFYFVNIDIDFQGSNINIWPNASVFNLSASYITSSFLYTFSVGTVETLTSYASPTSFLTPSSSPTNTPYSLTAGFESEFVTIPHSSPFSSTNEEDSNVKEKSTSNTKIIIIAVVCSVIVIIAIVIVIVIIVIKKRKATSYKDDFNEPETIINKELRMEYTSTVFESNAIDPFKEDIDNELDTVASIL